MKHISRKIVFSAFLILCLLFTISVVSLPQATFAANITLSAGVQVSFPTSITFSVNAKTSATITKLRLHYIVQKDNFATVVSEGWPVFTPSSSVSTNWLWDLRKTGGLPPGTQIEYWWTADDSAGAHAESAHATASFDDNRYKWQSITQSPVTLYWYNGDTAFANALMTAAQQGLQRIENDTGAIPKGSVRIYIYASAQELQGAQLFTPQWEGGATFQGYNVIAIGVSPGILSYGQTAVPHELTHWIIGQVTFNDYDAGLPTWLDEGLATYGEGALNPQYQSALNNAIKNKQLISVRSLASPFSADPTQAYISYGESNSIVTFMIQKYGKDKMVQLLDTFHNGAGYDEALQKVYGFDQDGLQAAWMASLTSKSSSSSIIEPLPEFAGLYLASAGVNAIATRPCVLGDYFEN